MRGRSGNLVRGLALGLVLALSLGVMALAAEPGEKSLTERRQADLDALYTGLQAGHPDLFANRPEGAFLARKAEIEKTLAQGSDFAFALELASLTALAGDSHTQVAFGGLTKDVNYYPAAFSWYDGKWVLQSAVESQAALLGAEVTALNGKTMDEVLALFSKVMSADNPVKLRRQFKQVCNAADFYEYLGITTAGQGLTVSLRDSEGKAQTLELSPLSQEALQDNKALSLNAQRETVPATAYDKSRLYFALRLDEDNYYMQYNSCRQDPELPMKDFAAQVRQTLDGGAYRRIIIDLRNNGGGSDGVIWPLLEVFRSELNQGTELVCLIGEASFSSAIINAVELQEMGAVLVGEATSGSVDHFGAVNGFSLPYTPVKVQHSTKFIDMETLLDAAAGKGVETLLPDMSVPQTLADQLAGKDSAVEWLLGQKNPLSQAVRRDAPLTRGRFIGELYDAAQPLRQADPTPDGSQDMPPYDDLLGIEWFLDPLRWASETGIARGTAEGGFAATRHLSWQEAAVFAVRTAQVLKLAPKTVETADGAFTCAPWAEDAVEQAWAWGLLEDAGQDLRANLTRQQGAVLIEKLFDK